MKKVRAMFIRLLALFIVIPLLELALLIKIGEYVGLIWTIILVGSTGAVGISLARAQGLAVINKVKQSLSQGQLPQNSLLDGILVLVGAAMLLTPGLLTDVGGFSLIIPVSRKLIRTVVKKQLKDKFEFTSYNNFDSTEPESEIDEEEIIDIDDYEEVE